ncbi:MAG: VWA domain-containing protein [Thermoanaerobaculales bacterium]|nr:VWA domain-containing protein [Thermoanaerobaculales bacterium]
MTVRLITLLLVLTHPLAAAEKEPTRILLVVDASTSMNSAFGQGRATRFGTVRTAIDLLATALEGIKDQPEVAVRIFGGTINLNDQLSCSDTTLIRPWAPASEGNLNAVLDNVRPRGGSPLACALAAAVQDLGNPRPDDLVIVILDSLDTCDSDIDPAIEELLAGGEGAEVHFLGPGLPIEDQASLAATGVAFHSTGWPSQFKAVFFAVISKQIPPAGEKIPIPLDPLSDVPFAFRPTSLHFVLPDSTEVMSIDLSTTDRTSPTHPFSATITIGGANEDDRVQFVRASIRPGLPLMLEPLEENNTSLNLEFSPAGWGLQPTVRVSWQNAPGGPLRLVLSREGAPGASWIEALAISGSSGQASFPLPDRPTPVVVQLRRRGPYNTLVLAESPFAAEGRRVELHVPAQVEAGTSLPVSWDGDVVAGDTVTLVPKDSSVENLGPRFSPVDAPSTDLGFPLDECTWEIRFLASRTSQILARKTVNVTQAKAGFNAPTQVSTGADLLVRWWGPGHRSDAITIGEPENSPGEYIAWADPRLGSPAILQAPLDPGEYEIRYLSDRDGVLASQIITVEETPIQIEAPSQVVAGRRFPLSWRGPNGPDDFLIIVPAGASTSKHKDFVFVSTGSPTTLAAPDKTGAYEIRYVAGNPREVLATVEVTVVE